MIPSKERYTELLALTQLYLLQEYPNKGSIPVGLDTYNYFKQLALQQKSQNQKAPTIAPMPMPTKPPSPLPPAPQKTQVPSVPQNTATVPPVPEPQIKPATQEKTVASKSENFVLEPISVVTPTELNDVRQAVTERFPAQKIVDTIPSNDETKKNESGWHKEMGVPEVVILSFTEVPSQVIFLQNIAKAIQDRLSTTAQVMSAGQLEQEGSWEALLNAKGIRLIIASDHALPTVPRLMQYYRELPKHAKYFVGKVPLCLMSDISLYQSEPQLKAPLWKMIQSMLQR